MPVRILSWILFAAIALGAILLFNYWASYQLLSTLAYAGIVTALLGLANFAFPFRFLGIRKRAIGALTLASGVALALAALYWPAGTIRVAQHGTVLDDIMPEYQFFERHSARVHARPEQVMEAARQSTFADMKSLITLMKIRAAALRLPPQQAGGLGSDMRILDAFGMSGYASGGSAHEVVMCGGANVRAQRPLTFHTLQECTEDHESGAVKIAFNVSAEDAGDGWSIATTETRVLALDDSARGAARYWRLIVPGSGLLRRQWLDGIKRRAEGKQ